MIGRQIAIELAHIAGGIVLALVIGWGAGAAWAVPLARGDIWTVVIVAIAVVLLMGIRPLREAATGAHRDDGAGGEQAQ